MKRIVLIIFIVIFVISCKKEEKGFRIDVAISGVSDGTKVTLKKRNSNEILVIDSTVVKNNAFSFKGNIKEPLIFGIFVDGLKQAILPFTDVDDKISIIAYKDSLVTSKITGSALNDELFRMRNERKTLEKEGRPFMTEYMKARELGDKVKMELLKLKMDVIREKSLTNDWNFIKEHPNSFVAPVIFKGLMAYPEYKDSLQIVFNNFSDEIRSAEISKELKEYLRFINEKKETPKK